MIIIVLVSKNPSSKFKLDLGTEGNSDRNLPLNSASSTTSIRSNKDDILITGNWNFKNRHGLIEDLKIENLKVFRSHYPVDRVKIVNCFPEIKLNQTLVDGTITLQLLLGDYEPNKMFLCDVIGVEEKNGIVRGTLTNDNKLKNRLMEEQFISTFTELKQVPLKLSQTDIYKSSIATIEEENY